MRVYAKSNQNGEEFAIGNIFRFANAGITDALEGADGNTVIKMNDDASGLIGKEINAFFYKDSSGYTSVLPQAAPTVFKNIVEEFNENSVQYHMNKAEGYYTKFILPKIQENATRDPQDTMPDFVKDQQGDTESVPF
jgi:hypothetical protein